VLTLPGWMVERTKPGDVSMVNPKQLPALIRERSSQPVSAALRRRMEQIGVVLANRCRDVPFPGVEVAKEAKKRARRALQKKAKAERCDPEPTVFAPSAQPAVAVLNAR